MKPSIRSSKQDVLIIESILGVINLYLLGLKNLSHPVLNSWAKILLKFSEGKWPSFRNIGCQSGADLGTIAVEEGSLCHGTYCVSRK